MYRQVVHCQTNFPKQRSVFIPQELLETNMRLVFDKKRKRTQLICTDLQVFP